MVGEENDRPVEHLLSTVRPGLQPIPLQPNSQKLSDRLLCHHVGQAVFELTVGGQGGIGGEPPLWFGDAAILDLLPGDLRPVPVSSAAAGWPPGGAG